MNKSYLLKEVSRSLQFPLRLETIEYSEKCFPSRGDQTASSLSFTFRFSSRDSITNLEADGKRYNFGLPCLLIRHAGSHYFTHEQQCHHEWQAIYFTYPEECSLLFSEMGIDMNLTGWEFDTSERFFFLLREILALNDLIHNPGSADSLDLLAFHMILESFNSYRSKTLITHENDIRIRSLASWVHTHYTEPVNWNDLMRRFGLSRSAFFREWQKVYPRSPTNFLEELRMTHAQRLLIESDLKIYKIALESGFCDVKNFHRSFRRKFNFTPLKYRIQKQEQLKIALR